RARTLARRPGGTPASRWGGTPPLRLDGTPALSSSRTPASKWGGASTTDRRTTDRRTTCSGRDQSREQVPRALWNRFFESGCSEGRTEPGLSGAIRSCAGELPPWWEAPGPTGAARCCHGQGNPRRRQYAHSPAEGAGAVPLHVRDRARRGALRRGRELLRLGRRGAAVSQRHPGPRPEGEVPLRAAGRVPDRGGAEHVRGPRCSSGPARWRRAAGGTGAGPRRPGSRAGGRCAPERQRPGLRRARGLFSGPSVVVALRRLVPLPAEVCANLPGWDHFTSPVLVPAGIDAPLPVAGVLAGSGRA